MILDRHLSDRVTVVRRGESTERDRYGNPVETDEQRTPGEPALLYRESARELEADRSTVVESWRAILRPHLTLDAGDQLERESDGATFELAGPPEAIRRPGRGRRVHHLEAVLTYVTGG